MQFHYSVLFVCHGNICRSPMAEFIMKDMVKKNRMQDRFHIESAATSTEELGNAVYPPAKRILAAHGLSCEGKRARQMTKQDYENFDFIIAMDRYNLRNMTPFVGNDPDRKVHLLLRFANRGDDVADPWYTGDFESTWNDIYEGCTAFYQYLLKRST